MDKNKNGNIDEGYVPQVPNREERGYTPSPGNINNGYQPSTNTGNSNMPEPTENEEV